MSTPEDPTQPNSRSGEPRSESWSFETKQVHAGQTPDIATNARALPIYQTTSYTFNSTEHAAALFGLAEPGNIYTRIMNPTQDVVEQRIAALEGGVAALFLASGQAAETFAILNLANAGDHIVSSPRLYGGTYNLFHYTLPKLGIEVSFVENPDDLESWRAAVKPNTKAFFGETISNPQNDILDIPNIAAVAHDAGVPLIVDNTVATPIGARVLDLGADIAVHSLTKFIGGHGTSIGGALVDAGRFDWVANGARFPGLTQPDPSYHGVVWSDALGPAAYIGRARTVLLRNTGAALSPFNAFLFLQGIETLPLRMERHNENALKIARWLDAHDAVAWVAYPGLEGDRYHEVAGRVLRGGYGALITFGVSGGLEAGRAFIESLGLFSHLANIGDAKSLAIHNATTTHSQLNAEELAAAGVSEDAVRLSVGIEHVDALVADHDQALAKARTPQTA
jgi:O-acetylhomoserine (thiol)-lyase